MAKKADNSAYEHGIEQDVFIKTGNGSVYEGKSHAK